MPVAVQQPRPPRLKKWTQAEYLELVERGAFRNQRVYLFRGDIIELAPQSHPHEFAIMRLSRYLTSAFPEPFGVRIQLGFIAPGQSVPEPDAAVCTWEDAVRKPHPVRAELVVEVAYTSLRGDRLLAAEYAAARVPEYWIIDTDGRRLEVYQVPAEDPAAPLGFSYADVRLLGADEVIAPAQRPDAPVSVASFFP